MVYVVRTVVCLTVFMLWVVPNAALAAERCLEGKTASGECANAGLTARARQNSLLFAQPKISETAQPIMPEEDYRYRYPHQLTNTPPQVSRPGIPGLPPQIN
jgi:hypothetical protein